MLDNCINAHILKVRILYCIRSKTQNFPIGYIVFNSPLFDANLNEWSLDFWMGERFRGRKIMQSCLNNVLNYLQRMEVPVIKALVGQNNIKSEKIIQKLHFVHEGDVAGIDINNEWSKHRLFSRVLN